MERPSFVMKNRNIVKKELNNKQKNFQREYRKKYFNKEVINLKNNILGDNL